MGTLHRAKHASVTEIWYGGKAMWALRITKMQWNSICTGFDTSGCSIPDYFSSVEVISSSNPNLQNFPEAHVCQDSRALEMFSINRLASFPNKKKWRETEQLPLIDGITSDTKVQGVYTKFGYHIRRLPHAILTSDSRIFIPPKAYPVSDAYCSQDIRYCHAYNKNLSTVCIEILVLTCYYFHWGHNHTAIWEKLLECVTIQLIKRMMAITTTTKRDQYKA